MLKRHFLAAAGLGVASTLPVRAAAPAGAARSGPGLLTVAGAILKSNRGPLDAALDQLMVKHGVKFDKAWEFDAAMLARLPAVTIEPTLEYDAKPHKLRGPLLTTVAVSVADANRYRMIVATTIDGTPMSLGGLGPLWAVYDADRLADFKDKPLKERFAMCPWGMYFIDVKPL